MFKMEPAQFFLFNWTIFLEVIFSLGHIPWRCPKEEPLQVAGVKFFCLDAIAVILSPTVSKQLEGWMFKMEQTVQYWREYETKLLIGSSLTP